MAVGEKSFTTAGVTPKRFNNEPPPSKVWEAKLLTSNCEIRRKEEPGKFPRVDYAVELLNSAPEGGKNRMVYLMLLLSLKPGQDGIRNPERANQLAGLAKALAEDATVPSDAFIEMADEDGEKWDVISPQWAKAWLVERDGRVVKLKTRIKREKDRDPKAEVEYFVEASAGGDMWGGGQQELPLKAPEPTPEPEAPKGKAKGKKKA